MSQMELLLGYRDYLRGNICRESAVQPLPGYSDYLRGDICRESAVQPPRMKFLLTKVKREPITKTRETKERKEELFPLIFKSFFHLTILDGRNKI